jgi:hypothetical protein
MNQKFTYTILAVVFIIAPSFSQQNKQIVVNLSPVVIENGQYIFEGHRVSFEAMMIPFIYAHDDKINTKLRVLNTTKDVFKLAIAVPLIYLFIQLLNADPQTGSSIYQSNKALIWTTVGTTWAYYITIPLLKKGIINRYNEVVLQPRAQLSPSGFNAGFVIRF